MSVEPWDSNLEILINKDVDCESYPAGMSVDRESFYIYGHGRLAEPPLPMTKEQILYQIQLIRNCIATGKSQDPKMIIEMIDSWLEGLQQFPC